MNDAAERVHQARYRLGSYAHQLTPTKTFSPFQTERWDLLSDEFEGAVRAAERRATVERQ